MYTRASPTDILARKSARRTKVRRQVVHSRPACPARGELNGPRRAAAVGLPRAPRQADFRASILAEVGEEVRVGVGVRPLEFRYYATSVKVSNDVYTFSRQVKALDCNYTVAVAGRKTYIPNLYKQTARLHAPCIKPRSKELIMCRSCLQCCRV